MTHSPTPHSHTEESVWERRSQLIFENTTYVLLAVSSALVLAQPLDMRQRLVAVLLALIAGAWIVVFLRVSCDDDARRLPTTLCFFAFLAITTVMVLFHELFFPVVIGGFFFAYLLRPWPVAVLGVGLTSVVLNTFVVVETFPPPNATAWTLYLLIIVVQTASIGGGAVVGQKMSELHAESRRTVNRLQAALDENAGLHDQLMVQAHEAGVRNERQRLAREIHDTLAQGLTGIVTQLEAATRAQDDPAAQRTRIDTAMRLARESLTDARRSVHALAPEPLDEARSLPEALSDVGRRWSQANGVTAELTTTGDRQRLHPAIEVTLLRVAQEALANVARHAGASRVAVTLSYMPDVVTLDVRDDGAGFSPPPAAAGNGGGPAGGFGLTAMRQRLAEVGGVLAVESEPGTGTSICATVPALPPGLTPQTNTGASDAPADHDEGAHRR